MEVGFDMLEEWEEEPLTSNMSDVHRLRRVGEDPDRVRDAMMADDTKGVELMMKQTVENGFPQDRVADLQRIVTSVDVWRTKFRADDPPAKVEPMEIELKPDARHYRCAARKLNPYEKRFLDAFAAILLEAGVIWKNDRSKYCSPVNPVLKPGGIHKRDLKSKEWSDEELLQHFRLTIDYRVINSMTVPSAGAMPFQVEILEHVQGAVVLAVFDLIKGFWQMPLAEASRQVLSFMVNGKIMTPTRVMQGHVDSALYFQKTMENVCGSLLYHNLLAWIDDVLLFAKSIDEYLEKLETFLGLMQTHGLKLNPLKCRLYNTSVKWCGRVISGQGVKHDPARVEALQAIPYPTNAGQLQQFLCSVNWMRDHIPGYATRVALLTKRLDESLKGKGRKKRVAAGVLVDLSPDERECWDAIKRDLSTMVEVAYPHEDANMCLLTDASDEGWSIIVTQVHDFNETIPIDEQEHEMLTCQSGLFTDPGLPWYPHRQCHIHISDSRLRGRRGWSLRQEMERLGDTQRERMSCRHGCLG
ncbi:Aste57867_19002 [Aphanomyces stellatus]|uniref:Aste57867_19002 protein n=1 Tax=Aphanomyces stellatus TaxID=120398 RepID=A0A485LD77_9STRA|nr:hypothetical protein As57867_018938 [Aphanomyces stellatus]VFT95728.1 Aste57867_19002 [Aphanomyces stellatus]